MVGVQEMRVVAVGVDPQRSQPILLLQEAAGRNRVLPVWVGVPEATAIEMERNGVSTPRPTTHRLIGNVIDALGRRLEHVLITVVRDDVFHAELVLDEQTRVSARVSDAVALALHLHVPIRSEDSVLDVAGLPGDDVIDMSVGGGGADRTDPTEEIEQFRRFLDTASPEDFDPS